VDAVVTLATLAESKRVGELVSVVGMLTMSTTGVEVAELLAASNARAVYSCAPASASLRFTVKVYGATAPEPRSAAPS